MTTVLLDIHTQLPRIGIRTDWPSLEMDTSPARLHIERTRGGMQIERSAAELSLDSAAVRRQAGRYSVAEATEAAAQRGQRNVLDFAARVAGDGNLLGDLTRPGNTVAELAAKNSRPSAGAQPYELPATTAIHWAPSSLSVQFTPDQLHFSFVGGDTSYEFRRGKVQIFLEQPGYVEIRYTGQPLYIPPRVDERA